MIVIKTKEEIDALRVGGKRLAKILKTVAKEVRPGISAYTLDQLAEKLIREGGDTPAFKNFKPDLHAKPFPYSLCVSVNGEVVHGMPTKDKILREGDIVSLDLGVRHKNLYTDHAVTVSVGSVSPEKKRLMKITQEALAIGIKKAKAGNRVGDIGNAIETYIKPFGYGIVRELAGHGVGREIHEDPYVQNYGRKGTGALLKEGMVIAIEPMITLGNRAVKVLPDGYTVVTKDNSPAAHFEHTVLITKKGGEILTKN
jgi:methionyl aminopeptidase